MTSFVAAVEDAERAQTIVDLKAARAALVTRGWCRSELVNDGQVCALGAVGAATVEGFMDMTDEERQFDELHSERPSRVWTALEAFVLGTYGGVMFFNDHPSTTKEDVLDLFDKTICNLGGAL